MEKNLLMNHDELGSEDVHQNFYTENKLTGQHERILRNSVGVELAH